MAWYVYVLRCGDGSLYTGSTTDVQRREAAIKKLPRTEKLKLIEKGEIV